MQHRWSATDDQVLANLYSIVREQYSVPCKGCTPEKKVQIY